MSTAVTQGATAPATGITHSTDWPFLPAAVLATALLVALVILDGEPRSAGLIAAGFGLGVAFLKTEFSFTASWRRFLARGEAGGLPPGPRLLPTPAPRHAPEGGRRRPLPRPGPPAPAPLL